MQPDESRRLWWLTEPYHAVTYFAPEIPESSARLGLKGFWMSYFAGRAAPLGAVPASVVTATFFNFAPRLVSRALPDAWALASPQAVLDDRLAAVDRALRRLLGPASAGDEVRRAAAQARAAADGAAIAGRPLAAAWQEATPSPTPHLDLWLALTVLREHRGDGHVALLTAAGIDGCQAHVLLVAAGRSTRHTQQPARGWTDDEWTAAETSLVDRGWLDGPDRLTDAGAAVHRDLEASTDALARQPWLVLSDDQRRAFADTMEGLRARLVDQGSLPFPNPMGLPARLDPAPSAGQDQ